MFDFNTDAESQEYCEEIVCEIIALFGLTRNESIRRVNQYWKGTSIIGDDHVIYHENTDYWAKDICYGHESRWWLNEKAASLKPA